MFVYFVENEERLDLIKRNTLEVITLKDLEELISTGKPLTAYIGRAPTGSIHLGHLIALGKLFDFEKAGIHTKILIADIHAALDDLKSGWDELDKRVDYTKKCIELAFDWERLPEFVRGSDFELSRSYVTDVLKLSTLTTVERALHSASEVTRMKNPKVSELIYPIMQALDEEYLDADIQLGGMDQRHIFGYAREYLEKLGYKKRVEIMTPLVSSIKGPGTKMSSSVPESNIKIYDSEESLKRKIMNSYSPEGVVKDNFIIQIVNLFILPNDGKLHVERDSKFGGDIDIESPEQLLKLYTEKKIHPLDLKKAIAENLIKRFQNARDYFERQTDLLKEMGDSFLPF
ncbi:MAG: Tyrosyl-tRNA synthetase [Candidatus Parvarchaeum acidophilus ARMAN-5_'5-way FS']|jgi:tyrosyl-tRNA synthetase|uniref:Tyrosine--tRNA ligase n=2 Tax=Parvarchaeum acidophilus TaxID=662761 RepID=D6GWU8_PARA5|nr:MAG: tyrosyl-tRNA synthetase [Candidatus Parvarchaeum acidophilus ARMAN-5]EGD71967.1 MAG: Tyrosyl-tRNA synthetase [Candidatus Parvarchaeum acidophilus ARMAN-5_'5-way FS']